MMKMKMMMNKSSLAAVKSPNRLTLATLGFNSHSHREHERERESERERERGARGLTLLA